MDRRRHLGDVDLVNFLAMGSGLGFDPRRDYVDRLVLA
jgi:hypothetical protein